ncbi:DUF3967 domain-containing protein [Peribacillus loiseleuriae]|uniref:DUF3967 domain-containing protein n=1 Tax=Peribacillus loiseleuriae TaxID=1679170 RepID=UPI003808B733
MEEFEKAYTPKEMSLTLDIGDSTLRKWAIALEKSGYEFIRIDNNRRFVDTDVVTLRHFKELVQVHGMQLNNAAMVVIDRFGKGPLQKRTGIVPAETEKNERDLDRSDNEVVTKLLNYIEKQEERFKKQEDFNEKLIERLDQQQAYIENSVKRRDELLMQNMRESQENKKLLLAAQEERKKRKGIFKFFSKD